jgi:hypothetical protein
MRSAVFAGLVIMALGAGSVFAVVSARPGPRASGKRASAPRAISGGSKAGPNGAISGGVIKQTPPASKIKRTRKIKQRHLLTHKRFKKS